MGWVGGWLVRGVGGWYVGWVGGTWGGWVVRGVGEWVGGVLGQRVQTAFELSFSPLLLTHTRSEGLNYDRSGKTRRLSPSKAWTRAYTGHLRVQSSAATQSPSLPQPISNHAPTVTSQHAPTHTRASLTGAVISGHPVAVTAAADLKPRAKRDVTARQL